MDLCGTALACFLLLFCFLLAPKTLSRPQDVSRVSASHVFVPQGPQGPQGRPYDRRRGAPCRQLCCHGEFSCTPTGFDSGFRIPSHIRIQSRLIQLRHITSRAGAAGAGAAYRTALRTGTATAERGQPAPSQQRTLPRISTAPAERGQPAQPALPAQPAPQAQRSAKCAGPDCAGTAYHASHPASTGAAAERTAPRTPQAQEQPAQALTTRPCPSALSGKRQAERGHPAPPANQRRRRSVHT